MSHTDVMTDTAPKYKRIADELRAGIVSGIFAQGVKLPSDFELSKQFDSSRLTVIRAVRLLEEEGLLERKAGSGTYIGARTQEDMHSFGLLIPDLGEGEIFEPICQGMARAGINSQRALLWGNTTGSPGDKEAQAVELCRSFIARKVSGVFFAPLEHAVHTEEVNERILSQLDEAHIPTILLDRGTRPFPEPNRHDLVGIDNWREGFRMAKYLIDLGCTRLGFVMLPDSAPTVDARVAGLAEALRQKGLSFPAEYILRDDPGNKSLVQRWYDALRPDGILCATDYTAGQLMHALLNAGIKVPTDVRIVGFDDVKYASLLPVPLTTLRQPCREIGEAAMKAMLARLEDPHMVARTISLDCEIIVRDSCGGKQREPASI
jgi:GntR family transcriptional regulator, arabinose operon transcriptional repressor